MNHREPSMAEPEDESALDIFEVDEYGTIRPRSAAEVSLNRQIFTDVDPNRLDTPDDLVEAIESAYPLQVRVETIAEAEIGDDEDLDDEIWRIWVARLDAADLAALRQKVLDWLDEKRTGNGPNSSRSTPARRARAWPTSSRWGSTTSMRSASCSSTATTRAAAISRPS